MKRRLALSAAWAVATVVGLGALAGAPGVSRDEAAVVAAAERPSAATARPEPPLARTLARGGHALGVRLGLSHVRSFRLGTALAGALLSALLAASAWSLAGPGAAAVAPALFWLAPRDLHAGLVATPDLALAALALGAVLAWRRALAAATRPARGGSAILAGLLLGAAVLARADAWTLGAAFALHAAMHRRLAGAAAEARPDGAPGKLAVAVPVAAALALAAWPAALGAGPGPWLPRPLGASFPLLPLAVLPAPFLWAFAGGAAHAAVRLVRALRARVPAAGASDDALLLLAAAAALAGSALAHAPAGARPSLHAMPVLALLGARALWRAAALAWPSRSGALAASLALLVLYPGLRATLHAYPHGASAWNELVGGAPGAASRGLRRQDGGEAVAALLPALRARAERDGSVWWPGVDPGAVALYARDGGLRPDLALATDLREATLAVVPLDGGPRDAEYRAWSELRTARPVAGVYVDEVPVAFVYARPGAWR